MRSVLSQGASQPPRKVIQSRTLNIPPAVLMSALHHALFSETVMATLGMSAVTEGCPQAGPQGSGEEGVYEKALNLIQLSVTAFTQASSKNLSAASLALVSAFLFFFRLFLLLFRLTDFTAPSASKSGGNNGASEDTSAET